MRVCFSADDESPISQLNTKTASLIAPTPMHIETNLIRAVSVFYYRLNSIFPFSNGLAERAFLVSIVTSVTIMALRTENVIIESSGFSSTKSRVYSKRLRLRDRLSPAIDRKRNKRDIMSFLSSEIGVRDFKKYSKYSFLWLFIFMTRKIQRVKNSPTIRLMKNVINIATFLIYNWNGLKALCDKIKLRLIALSKVDISESL